MARMAPIMAAPPAISYFIFSMPSAGLMEMPPLSKVTPLPTRPRCAGGGRRGRAVAQHDQHGRFGAALRHSQQRAHPQLFHGLAIQHFARKTVFVGRAPGRFGHTIGGELVGGFVRQRCG